MGLIRTQIVRKFQGTAGDVITGATAVIYSLPDNGTATVYSAESGTATIAQPLTTGVDGGLSGWLEIGDYYITVTSPSGTATARYYANHPQQSYLETYGTVDVPLTVKAGTALTANLSEWKNSSGGTVASISTAGSVTSPTITAIQGSVTNTQGSVNSTQGSVVTLSGTVGTAVTNISNISGSVTALAGTAGTAVNLTATQGSVAALAGTAGTAWSITALAGTAGTAVNLTATQGSVAALSGSISTNTQTQPIGTISTNYTLGTADAGKFFRITANATITIPTNGSAPFAIGQRMDFMQIGGTNLGVGFSGAGGVTLYSTPSSTLRALYSGASLIKIGTNEWSLVGDLN